MPHVDPLLLSIMMAAPLLLSIVLKRDFVFMWVQFTMSAIFEVFAVSLDQNAYFGTATVVNMVIGLIAWRASWAYAVSYFLFGAFTYARMAEYISFTGGYFTLIFNLILCGILAARFIRYNNKG